MLRRFRRYRKTGQACWRRRERRGWRSLSGGSGSGSGRPRRAGRPLCDRQLRRGPGHEIFLREAVEPADRDDDLRAALVHLLEGDHAVEAVLSALQASTVALALGGEGLPRSRAARDRERRARRRAGRSAATARATACGDPAALRASIVRPRTRRVEREHGEHDRRPVRAVHADEL